jgi:hypothetical protein
MKAHTATWLTLTPFLFLSGCGGEPSEGDLREALEQQIAQASANPFAQMAAGAMGGDKDAKLVDIHDLNKLGCKEDGDNAYVCDIEVDVSVMGARQQSASRVRMVRGKEGWLASQ